ncbi:hypothetical protein D3C86_1500920 [compost metagenome]
MLTEGHHRFDEFFSRAQVVHRIVDQFFTTQVDDQPACSHAVSVSALDTDVVEVTWVSHTADVVAVLVCEVDFWLSRRLLQALEERWPACDVVDLVVVIQYVVLRHGVSPAGL